MGYTFTLILGILLLVIALAMLQNTLIFLKNSDRATATVIEVERSENGDGDSFKPVFKFKTRSNEEIIHKPFISTYPPAWTVGEQVTIAYDVHNPSNVRVLTYFEAFIWTIILGAISMPLIFIGAGYHLLHSYLQ